MMYDEFIAGTGCRDNEYNMKIYKDLEILYMNSNLSKQEIYEYGKKLVNNDLSEKQKEWNKGIDEKVEELRSRLADFKEMLTRDEEACFFWKDEGVGYQDIYKRYKADVKYDRDEIKKIRAEIKLQLSCKYV